MIKLTWDTIDDQDIDDLCIWLKGNPQLTKGPETLLFEQEWAKYFDRKYAVFVNSGSSANFLMYAVAKEWGKQRGCNWNNRAYVQGIGWATTLAPAMQLGYDVTLLDVTKDRWSLDDWELDNKPKPDVLTVVHTLGVPGHMEGTKENPHSGLVSNMEDDVLLLEDCCSSYGSEIRGRKVGTYGDMSSFSLFFGHVSSSIEGGVVCTDREDFYELLLMLRSHGWAKDLSSERSDELADTWEREGLDRMFTFYHAGYNLRSTDLQAFLGRQQLKKLDKNIKARDKNHRHYARRLKDIVQIQKFDKKDTICSISFGMNLHTKEERQRIANALITGGVEIRPIAGGSLGRQPFWKRHNGGPTELPVADSLDATLLIPNHPGLTTGDIDFICDIIENNL